MKYTFELFHYLKLLLKYVYLKDWIFKYKTLIFECIFIFY